ncbi:MAG: T9SS type A sorting domain-containing protein [Prevotellaceae bacterium]|jgi:hypothetical protein|nr:T9SS type A sorting domain-containing protein [Prevotellaceae bacterium]
MHRKTLLISLLAVFFASTAAAQTIRFAYDPAGNRISRTIVLNAPAAAPQLQSQQVETPPYVEQLASDLQVRIFPNPTEGLLNVEIVGLSSDDVAPQIAVFAQSGQQLLNLNTSGTLTPVDLYAFPAGMYILRLTVRGKAETYQIIKK